MSVLLDAHEEVVELTSGSTVFRRIGDGPPVLVLHGYPETHRCWHLIAPTLAERHSVIAPDLPGYGDSRWPTDDDQLYAKRAMAVSHDRVDAGPRPRAVRRRWP